MRVAFITIMLLGAALAQTPSKPELPTQMKAVPVRRSGLTAKVVPSKKTRLSATALPDVTLNCSAGPVTTTNPVATGFNFLRSTNPSGPFVLLEPSPMMTTCGPYEDASVVPGTTYYYVADATNGTSTSGFSGVVTAAIPNTPTVTAISPAKGSTAGGTLVTITGTSFAAGATVTFDSTALLATNITLVNATTVTALTPADANASTVQVTLTNSNQLSGSLSNAFTYLGPAPTFNPPTGLAATVANGVIHLYWKAPSTTGVMTYGVYVCASTSGCAPSVLVVTTKYPINVAEDNSCQATCYYAIQANYASQSSGFSNIVATTR